MGASCVTDSYTVRETDCSFVRAALPLAARGMHVMPCRADKSPWTARGHLDAATDPAIIRHWGGAWPSATVGIACEASGIVVVDIDDPEPWQKFVWEHNLVVPETASVVTPSGGRHLYYKAPEGARYPGQLCAGVDIKHRGYVLAPPSVAVWFPRRVPWT